MKTIKAFAAVSNLDESLIRAVVRQVGGWDYFKEMAEDVTNHGADAGFHGFIYYTDTVRFFNNNRDDIKGLASNLASDLGEGMLEMISSFNCLKGADYTAEEIGETLYGPKRDVNTHIANALAWFAFEEVCCSYVDAVENN